MQCPEKNIETWAEWFDENVDHVIPNPFPNPAAFQVFGCLLYLWKLGKDGGAVCHHH